MELQTNVCYIILCTMNEYFLAKFVKPANIHQTQMLL